MLPRAVLFDMDGVLVRSNEVWFSVLEEAGRRFRGRPVTREEFLPTFGQGTLADLTVFGLRCTRQELDAFYEVEFARRLDQLWVNPEARPLLEALAGRSVGRAVVTNTAGALALAILERAGLAELLPVRATSDLVAHAKPAPDLVDLALQGLGLQPGEAWMVGDSAYDRLAARAAGVHFVGLGLDGDLRLERLADFPLP
jgi:phosphoglycolate phosphatase/AHBA synthesis associated protein